MTSRHKHSAAWRAAERKPKSAASNQDLAAIARGRAARSLVGSADRKAWGVVSVALSTTGSVSGARRVLGLVGQADARALGAQFLDHLTDEEQADA